MILVNPIFRDRLSRNGEKKSFGFKGKKSFFKKNDSGKSNFRDRPSRNGEKKSFGFKGKKSFFKKDNEKPVGFTNNPKYFEKKASENYLNKVEKKSSSFKRKKKFKSRSDRPKSFTFKKYSQKRVKI